MSDKPPTDQIPLTQDNLLAAAYVTHQAIEAARHVEAVKRFREALTECFDTDLGATDDHLDLDWRGRIFRIQRLEGYQGMSQDKLILYERFEDGTVGIRIDKGGFPLHHSFSDLAGLGSIIAVLTEDEP